MSNSVVETYNIRLVPRDGIIRNTDGSTIEVKKGCFVIYDDGNWSIVSDLDPSYYDEIKELEYAIEKVEKGLDNHSKDTSNPHQVTASQIGAYTKEDVNAEIKKESDARELYDAQLRESIEALEKKTGEYVTGDEVSAAVAAEADARIQEDIAINARIDMIPQTDWNETDVGSMAYLANHPTPISELDIEALFS